MNVLGLNKDGFPQGKDPELNLKDIVGKANENGGGYEE